MAGFLRGKQAGIQNDLSAGIMPELFAPDDQARYGINSQIGFVTASSVDTGVLTLFLVALLRTIPYSPYSPLGQTKLHSEVGKYMSSVKDEFKLPLPFRGGHP